MLTDLSGSLASVAQALNATGGTNPQHQPGLYKYRKWQRPEISFFFKADWKVTPNLTLNLGVRWEYYGVPSDPEGRTATTVGGTGSPNRKLDNEDWNNFGPAVGLSYALRWTPKSGQFCAVA